MRVARRDSGLLSNPIQSAGPARSRPSSEEDRLAEDGAGRSYLEYSALCQIPTSSAFFDSPSDIPPTRRWHSTRLLRSQLPLSLRISLSPPRSRGWLQLGSPTARIIGGVVAPLEPCVEAKRLYRSSRTWQSGPPNSSPPPLSVQESRTTTQTPSKLSPQEPSQPAPFPVRRISRTPSDTPAVPTACVWLELTENKREIFFVPSLFPGLVLGRC